MFKKLVIVSAVLAASSSFAGPHHPYRPVVNYKAEAPSSVPVCPGYSFCPSPYVGLSVGVRDNSTRTPNFYKGIEGTLSLGYGGLWTPNFFLAGEVFAADSAKVRNDVSPGSVGVRSTWSFGADVLPGILLTDYVMTYVRAGVVTTRFSNVGHYRTGWQVGIGGQANLGCTNFDIRGEYVYSQYPRIREIGTPRADQFNLGLVYRFM